MKVLTALPYFTMMAMPISRGQPLIHLLISLPFNLMEKNLTLMRPMTIMKVKMSLIWSSPSNSNMNSNKDCYNQQTVKKFENYRLWTTTFNQQWNNSRINVQRLLLSTNCEKFEKFRKIGLSTITPHVILKWSQFNNCSICYRYKY